MVRRTQRRLFMASIAIVMIVGASGCSKKPKPAKPPKIGATENGIASWYGHPYHGRRAANGEIYDMEKLTAAHRTYPFNTWVRVKNLSNEKTVDVRIQDRGPFINGRIIDLSLAAAREIDLVRPGITKVKLTVIRPPRDVEVAKQAELFAIQVGAFRDRDRALALAEQMRPRFGDARVVERAADPRMYRVLAGAYETTEQAEAAARQVRESGGTALVVRLDEVSPQR